VLLGVLLGARGQLGGLGTLYKSLYFEKLGRLVSPRCLAAPTVG
jgi:hypothetical protein